MLMHILQCVGSMFGNDVAFARLYEEMIFSRSIMIDLFLTTDTVHTHTHTQLKKKKKKKKKKKTELN